MEQKKSIFEKLRKVLTPTRENIFKNILSRGAVSEEELEELEESLILSDMGVNTTSKIMGFLRNDKYFNKDELYRAIKQKLQDVLIDQVEKETLNNCPLILLVIGVNGVGKTTTIAKLAHKYKALGKKVLLVAGDTFRAAAIEQLQKWADKLNINLIKRQDGSDPGAVVFDALSAAKARGIEVIIVDTAGRMHHKTNLINELKKIKNICQKQTSNAYCKVLLVLDATTGQNAIKQVSLFNKEIGIDGIIMAKIDGTAKGGILVAICDEYAIPIEYLGIGEHLEDLIEFKMEDFVNALLELSNNRT